MYSDPKLRLSKSGNLFWASSFFNARYNVITCVCLETPEQFVAVGLWYEHFPQLTDEKVHGLL